MAEGILQNVSIYMKLLIFTQALDQNDPVLSAYHRLISEVARNFDSVTAVCLKKGEVDLPKNTKVLSLGKENGGGRWRSRLRYVVRFYTYIFGQKYDAVFVHMNQEYILLGGIFWKLMGKKVYMWRNHHAGSVLTDISAAFCTKVFCTSKFSYTAKYRKTVIMPVGIDTNMFTTNPLIKRVPRSVLFLARIAPVKRPDLLIEALADISSAGGDFIATIVGDPLPKDEAYYKNLQDAVTRHGLQGKVVFKKGVSNTEAIDLYNAHDVFVNLSSSGMYDKTIFEAMACGCLVLASNENLRGLIDNAFIFEQGNRHELSQKLSALLGISSHDRELKTVILRRVVEDHHSLVLLGKKLREEIAPRPFVKVLYLFSNTRAAKLEKVKQGYPDNGFCGFFRVRHYGVETEYVELEQYLPARLCRFLRMRVLNVYFSHIPFIWKFFSYDVVFHVGSFASQMVWIVLGLRKPKWVLYDYSLTGLLGEGKTFKQRLLRRIIDHSAGIITLSEKEARMLKERFPRLKDAIRFIPYGTDLEYFKPQNVPEVEQILSIGFDRGRDYATLFEATKDLGIKVIATNSRHIKKLGPLPSHVELRSFTDPELVQEYAKSKIVVLPLDTRGGINDAMGCSTLVEAMAMGKPVIASRTFTMESYISHGENGLLVPERDVEALRDAIKKLLADEKLRQDLGRRARAFVETHCDSEKSAQQMADFFTSVSKVS